MNHILRQFVRILVPVSKRTVWKFLFVICKVVGLSSTDIYSMSCLPLNSRLVLSIMMLSHLSGFCGQTCICSRILWVKVLKHWPHFHRCQSLNSLLNWLVEVGLARTRWFFDPNWPKLVSDWTPTPTLSNREKLREHGEWGKTMDRMMAVDGEEDDDDEEGLPFLLKDWRDSCLVMASTTVAGTFTKDKIQNDLITQVVKREWILIKKHKHKKQNHSF